MYDTSCANQIDGAGWVDKTRRKDVEVVGGAVNHYCVTSIIASSSTAAESGALGEDVDKFALAFVAPLRAEDKSSGHVEDEGRQEEFTANQ